MSRQLDFVGEVRKGRRDSGGSEAREPRSNKER